MTEFSIIASGRRSLSGGPSLISATPNAKYMAERLTPAKLSNVARPTGVVGHELMSARNSTLEEKLFDARALCKMSTRAFAMRFDPEWQKRFFGQLDQLMDVDEWDVDDEPVTSESFMTLIRLLMLLRGRRRPGLGIANGGNIVAAWSRAPNDRITVECMARDRVRWLVSMPQEEGQETAAGHTTLDRLLNNVQPYNPQHWWDNEGSKIT